MKTTKEEMGMVFVEASIVFPIVILAIFAIIFSANAYFQKCKVEAIVNELTMNGAAYCADPMAQTVASGGVPSLSDLNVYPYRALDGNGVGDVEGSIEEALVSQIESMGGGYFALMQPKIIEKDAIFHNGFIYSTFEVYVKYKITLPIRMMGEKENLSLTFSSRASVPVSDSSELIRNVDMIEDYLQQFGVDKKIEDFIASISGAIDKWKS